MEDSIEIHDLLISKGFRIVEQAASEYFGDYFETFSNDIFMIRLSSSMSSKSIDIRSIKDKDWHDLALVKRLLSQEKNLSEITTFNEYKLFLKQEIDVIQKVFNFENYFTAKKKIEELANKRASEIFNRTIQ